MKKTITGLLLLCLVGPLAWAQTSKVQENLTLRSKILSSDRKYAIYLPADYETSDRSYPVLYLLHGGGDDQTGWVQFGEVKHIADKAIADGSATSMIIVMPDANTGVRGYFNDVRGKWRYEDFFFSEFMPYIEKTYRIKPEKRFRAIAGLSMGGGGTLMYTLRHPELFSSACALSASAGPVDIADAEVRLKRTMPDATPEEVKRYYETQNAVILVNNMPEEQKKAVRWYIDCGDDDFLFEMNSLLHIAMRKKEIPHEFRVRDGGHTWTYWRTALPTVLSFITDSFHQR
ncbi:alpha/beta hydrolase [Rudanella lutea]|uniref:alpha/beta hydrolase n=1 Tax=Rudanella lutea TaxID=451374 RepID=UPI000369EBCB|nr:alpha/beta hydrolase-fold protein [Rudanella lutea]